MLTGVNGSDLPHMGLMGGVKEALWIEVPQVPCKPVTLEGSDYAEVDTIGFYGGRKDPALTPYATTVLVPSHRHDSSSVSVARVRFTTRYFRHFTLRRGEAKWTNLYVNKSVIQYFLQSERNKGSRGEGTKVQFSATVHAGGPEIGLGSQQFLLYIFSAIKNVS